MGISAAPIDARPLAASATAHETKQKLAARKAAEDFEAVFISQMMEPMFQGLKTDGLMGGGNGEAVFRSIMIQEVGKEIAKSGGVGISDSIYKEMLRMQGMSSTQIAAATSKSGIDGLSVYARQTARKEN